MTTLDPPIILLLFANDRSDGQYLRNLPAEAEALERTLVGLEPRARVITKANVTRAGLQRLLLRHARQTIGVHFGGHAHPDALYIEDERGRPTELNVSGLAGWFARMPRLRWVFLNGCATRAHVQTIHDRAPVTVVATDRAIRDDAAARFAAQFYAGLVHAWSIAESFAMAHDGLMLDPGEGPQRFLRPRESAPDDGVPWRLVKPAGIDADWTLTAELGSPLGYPAAGTPSHGVPAAPPAHRAAAPLDVLRAHLRSAHATLVPFFRPEDGPGFISDVYVELQLDCGLHRARRRAVDAEPDALGLPRVTLEDLMAGRHGIPSNGRWAVLGDPGAGKSTLARHLVWQHASDADTPLALYVGLADFAEFRGDPFAFVEERVAQGSGDAADGIAAALRTLADQSERLWVIFDGLDEVDPKRLRATRQQVEAFVGRWSRVTIAVCSRPIGYETLAGFSTARVRALDTRRQREMLDGWLGEADGARAFERVQAEVSLREAAGNPLLLSLMAKLAAEAPAKALPATRGELYGEALTLLLARGHSPAKRGLGSHTTAARRLLAVLSVALTEAGNEAWPCGLIEKTLRRAVRGNLDDRELLTDNQWKTASGFLDRIAHDTGILAEHDGQGGRWRYLHRSLRERLAAEALADAGTDAIIARIRVVADDEDQLGRWGETLGIACGQLEDPSEPLEGLMVTDDKLALRVLPELGGLKPRVALDVLFAIEPRLDGWNHIWDGETLHRLAAKWPADEAVVRLTQRVTPGMDLDRLAFIHHALTLLGRPPERVTFFAAAGRPVNGVPYIPWVSIEPGLFRMGDPDEAVSVHISTTFEIAATPVTVGQYRSFDPEHRCLGSAEHPVTEVSWWRAWLFAAWASGGLPTSAQWEFACRAGTTTRFWSGDDEADLERVGWFDRNSHGTQTVARKPASPWGLYDMHANVGEWCFDGDGLAPQHAADGAPLPDPLAPPTGGGRVLRGGSCVSPADYCRSALRLAGRPGFPYGNVGFRLVRPAPTP